MKNKIILPIILAVASLGIAVLAFFVLPEDVVIQFSVGSSGNSTAPKIVAILLPTALGIGGAVAAFFSKDSIKKSIIVSIVGIGLGVFMIVVNALMS